MGEGWTWEKNVDELLNRAKDFRLQGIKDKARVLEEAARAIFEANKHKIAEKINVAKGAIAALEQRAAALEQFLKTAPKPLPTNPVNMTALQNKAAWVEKFRLQVRLDPFLVLQVREWIMDYAAYRHGPDFYEEYKLRKEFIDQQWMLYYINGHTQYPINEDGYQRSRADSFT